MKSKLSLCTVFFVLSELCGQSAAVVNGEEPDRYEHPWSVVLRVKNTNFNLCSGTLIDRRWVVTNTHCVQFIRSIANPETPAYVLLGAHNMENDDEPGRQAVWVDRMYDHPNFTTNLAHDIGLMHLEKPAKVGQKTISVSKIASESDVKVIMKQKRRCALYAFGTQLKANDMWRGDINSISRVGVRLIECSKLPEAFQFNYSEDQICYKSVEPRTGSCGGDSGGTVVCRHHGKWLLVATLTWGYVAGKCRDVFHGGNLIYKNQNFIEGITGLTLQ